MLKYGDHIALLLHLSKKIDFKLWMKLSKKILDKFNDNDFKNLDKNQNPLIQKSKTLQGGPFEFALFVIKFFRTFIHARRLKI